MDSPVRQTGEGVILRIHAQPGAARSELCGLHGDALKVRLQAPRLMAVRMPNFAVLLRNFFR